MRHIKLFESFDTDITWYHGRGRKIDGFADSIEHITKEATNEQGPGIYLTSGPDDARKYGKFIHQVEFRPSGEILRKGDKIKPNDKAKAERLIKNFADNWKLEAQNYSPNIENGIKTYLRGNVDSAEDRVDFWLDVWYSFFRYDPKSFVKGMSSIGIDGMILPSYGGHGDFVHAVVYNADALSVVSVSQY